MGIFFQFSILSAQDITLWVEDIQTGGELDDGTARVYINMTTTVPVFSYSFTLSGFDNVLSNVGGMEPNCTAAQMFGEENVHVLENYFYGGGEDGNVNFIQPQVSTQFLILKAEYNPALNNALDNPLASPYYLELDEMIPGMNGNGTSFYTFNSETQEAELIQDVLWIERTWKIGFNEIYNSYNQDCSGDIHGLATWDECSVCSGGATGNVPNYDLDCAGDCFGDSKEDDFGGCCIPNEEGDFTLWFIDSDGDGFGETTGADQEECELLGGIFNNGLCTAMACYTPDGFVGNSDDNDVGCDGIYDECGVCDNDPSNNSFYLSETQFGGAYDCTGECYGTTQLLYWFSDCDFDGLADSNNSQPVCGEPTANDFNVLCPDGGNIISIDPDNHTFDPHINCTSNQVDECGSCDGDGYDCAGTCHPSSPLSEENNCNINGEGWGVSITISIENRYAQSTDLTEETYIHIFEGCRPYNGYDSDYEYSYLNGLDICGECYLGNLPPEQGNILSDYVFDPINEPELYLPNYSCKGCADKNAYNHDEDALFDDGSCSFQLYAGDVNRDGIVDELDLDGIAEFWNYYTDYPRDGASILWYPQLAQDDYWYDPSTGEESTSGCPMFADADGDALVTNGDVSAVLLNWGKEVSSQYYYPWGDTGEAPSCLSYNSALYIENYSDMYEYIIDNHDYNSGTEDAIEYLADLLNVDVGVNYIPDGITVHQNYPNPFNPETTFPLDLGGSENQDVTLKVYNLNGALVYKQTVNLYPGSYTSNSPFTWNAQGTSSGIYMYSFELVSDGDIVFNKIMLIK